MLLGMSEEKDSTSRVLTLDIKPRSREAIKPAELIQVSGHHELTLNARRAITILWHQAHLQGVEEGRWEGGVGACAAVGACWAGWASLFGGV